jgi:flagellar FliJ protein
VSSRADRLQPVVDLAVKREKDATIFMAEQRNQLAAAQTQLDELRKYRDEYGSISSGSDVATLMNRQQFLQRIDMAIVQQMSEVARREKAVVAAQEKWTQARGRAKALDLVTGNYREQERKAEDRREQSQADERSQYRKPA